MPPGEGPRSQPLPRKLLGNTAEAQALQAQFGLWKVDSYCKLLWLTNKFRRRRDTFIGLMDTDTWTLYLAPCFGVTADECERCFGKSATNKDGTLLELRVRLATFDRLPDDLQVVASSPAIEDDGTRQYRWSEIRGVYGKGVCLVPFYRSKPGFDGNSHPTLGLWIKHSNDITSKPAQDWLFRALGFAIQLDNLGYYVRFGSGFNHGAGSQVSDPDKSTVFARRSIKGQLDELDKKRDPRDLPKQWAQKLVEVLARDLHMSYFQPQSDKDFFDRMLARGDNQTTKFKRLT